MTRFLLRILGPALPANLRRAADLLAEPPAPTPTGTVSVPLDDTAANLDKIDHIVVLMLENRSFDSMLGYLSLEGVREDIDGLKGQEKNAYGGTPYPVHHLTRTAWNGELEDPCHGPACIDLQISNGAMSGFVQSYAEYLAGLEPGGVLPAGADIGLVMGYFNADDLPVYDHLAREYCVCNRWFSSVAGATWPNRLYSLAGCAAADREDASPPLYNLPTFVRHLERAGIDWRWYSYDPGTLRLVDGRYRLSHHRNFAYVDRRKLSVRERLAETALQEEGSFLDDAAAGTLPAVSWIDPHFKDIRVFGPDSNDDHPPSDVLAGQALVLDVYHALQNSPNWGKTLFLITYDEHGGIYDHVAPPSGIPDDSSDLDFHRYGVRVPAIVVSPWVAAGFATPPELVFDHTSIIKTILLRFCRQGDQIPDMGQRVTAANHLGTLLTEPQPRQNVASHADAQDRITSWRQEFVDRRYQSFEPETEPRTLNQLQDAYTEAARRLREAGLPSGHP
jgi:phospholipase C